MSQSKETLEAQIEQLVRAHVDASRRAATEAVLRAFSSAWARPRAGARTTEVGPAKRRASTARRSGSELQELGERLYEAIRAQPGETMSVLAPALGRTPRELARPMALLKRAGRVRSVGQRHHTRYFLAVERVDEDAD